MAKAGHQSWRKGVRGRGQKEGNEEGREESRKRDGRGRTRECAARPQSTSPRREPSNDAVHGGSRGHTGQLAQGRESTARYRAWVGNGGSI